MSEAVITNSTAAMAPKARPYTKGWPMSSMPSSEMTTVVPANSTARPDVSRARTAAPLGSRPSARPWR